MNEAKGETACYRLPTAVGDVYIHCVGGLPERISLFPQEAGRPLEVGEPPPAVRRLMRAVLESLQGRGVDPRLAEELLSSPGLTEFQRRVYRVVLSIPPGSTSSYREVAEAVGSPRAARAVGDAMRRNPFPLIIPCHRVIRSDGRPGGFRGPEGMKERLLRMEGAAFRRNSPP